MGKLLSRLSVKEGTIKYETSYKVKYIPQKTEYRKEQIRNSEDAYNHIRRYYKDEIYVSESFYLLFLNKNNETIGYAMLSTGGISETCVDIRIIAKYLIDTMSCCLIIAHNHPSGALKPSTQDKNVTEKISDLCDLLKVKLLDHVILSSSNYFSFADEGLL